MDSSSQSQLHTLHRSTGSAHYFAPNLDQEILCAVNAPVDVQRRDELPNETYVDVHIRPNHGVGMIRERHLETLIQRVAKDIILSRLWPRTAVQITLQILKDGSILSQEGITSTYLTILPALLNATCLALIDAGVPMRCPFTSTMVQIDKVGKTISHPALRNLKQTRSLHVLAFSSKGELLLIESEGPFTVSEFNSLVDTAKDICLGSDHDSRMAVDGEETATTDLLKELRDTVEHKMMSSNKWRGS